MLKWGHAIRKERRSPVTHDPSSPAENHERASEEHPAEEHPDPGAFAHQLFQHLAEVHGTDADVYLAHVIAELCELSPILREHLIDFVLVELVEELHQRGKPGVDAARIVAEVQHDWSQA
jgi:hypothetical protein